jgi:hypothetical protein
MKVLLGAVDRIEGIVVPDVPTHGHRRLRCLHRFIDCGVGLAKTVGPQHFPGGKFGIAQQQAPELDVVAVHWALAAACRANELFQLQRNPGALAPG